MSDLQYHLNELEVAGDADNPRRLMPPVLDGAGKILDVGCGAGQTLIRGGFAANQTLFGIDVDFAALQLGGSLSEQIHFVLGAGGSLPLRDESMDMIISRVAVPYMNVSVALADFYRVLKPGGQVWVSLHPLHQLIRDLRQNVRSARSAAYGSYVVANGLLLHLTGKTIAFPSARGPVESFQTKGGMRRVFRRCGFRDLQLHLAGCHFTVAARKPEDRHRKG